MIEQLVIDHALPNCGKITYDGMEDTYASSIGWDECETGRVMSSLLNWRSFMGFDTSAIPADATILAVSFRVRRRSADPMGMPQTYRLKFSMGTFIGEELNGTLDEFAAGTVVRTLFAKPADKDEVDLSADGVDPIPLINRSGYTDIKIWDQSTKGTGDDSWGTNFNQSSGERCRLLILYEIIEATATGRAYASASANVTHSGAGDATGIGEADCSAGLILSSSGGVAAGAGYAQAAGGLLLSSAQGQATGVGAASLSANLVASGVGVAAGAGFCELFGGLLWSASGMAAGIGTARLLAGLLLSSASGTATGVGTAAAAALLLLPPLAVFETTQSIAAVHSTTVALAAVDARTCNPRRN